MASIDSGVQFDHPALVNAYRGNNGDGTFDHDHNGSTPLASAPPRRATPTATARTPWAPWPAPTGPTRSVSPPRSSGSPRTGAARPTPR
ncbi:hypothetical protein V2I01_27170 [Micromonospora sp. BRA006-A]|nr:hypothetical protein [Micromonospora sp. BRA006-A]